MRLTLNKLSLGSAIKCLHMSWLLLQKLIRNFHIDYHFLLKLHELQFSKVSHFVLFQSIEAMNEGIFRCYQREFFP